MNLCPEESNQKQETFSLVLIPKCRNITVIYCNRNFGIDYTIKL